MDRDELLHAEVSGSVIAAFYEVYNHLGYGFLEFPYAAAMERELRDPKTSSRPGSRGPALLQGASALHVQARHAGR